MGADFGQDLAAQVGPEVPPVAGLYRFGEGLAGRLGVGGGAVAAGVLGPGVLSQPGGQGQGGAVGRDVDLLAGLGVDDHGGVAVSAFECEVSTPSTRGTRSGVTTWHMSMCRVVEREVPQAGTRDGRAPARPVNSRTTQASWVARRLVRHW